MFKLTWANIEAGIKLGVFVAGVLKQRFADRKVVVVDELGQPVAVSVDEFNAKIDALHAKADAIATAIDADIAERHKNDPPELPVPPVPPIGEE